MIGDMGPHPQPHLIPQPCPRTCSNYFTCDTPHTYWQAGSWPSTKAYFLFLYLTRMHSSRMRTTRSLSLSRSICRGTCMPPLPHTTPHHHACPRHACPPPHMPPLPCMPPHHAHPLHATHAPPPWTDRQL